MTYNDFYNEVTYMIEVIGKDLENLEKIAREGNEGAARTSSTTTTETTKAPGDWSTQKEDSKTPVHISRCTIPIVMVCFSVIDMMGQWMKVRPDDDFASSSDKFFTELAGRNDLINNDKKNKIKEYFRHGIMHSFFMKEGYSVAYPPHDIDSLFVDFETKKCTLNVRFLLKIVRIGMGKMLEYLKDESQPEAKQAFAGYQVWKEAY